MRDVRDVTNTGTMGMRILLIVTEISEISFAIRVDFFHGEQYSDISRVPSEGVFSRFFRSLICCE